MEIIWLPSLEPSLKSSEFVTDNEFDQILSRDFVQQK